MRNLQEGATTSARTMFHVRKGELRHGDRDGMEDQLGALGLILNAVPAWTRTRNWTSALLAFKIHFGDRLPD